MQDLGKMTAGINAREVSNKAGEKREPTFFDKQRARPEGEAAEKYQNAVISGQSKAAGFIATLGLPNHPDHNTNVARFNKEFGGDANKARAAIIAKTCEDADAPHPESLKEDPAYEKQVENKYRPGGINAPATDPIQMRFFDILKDQLKQSRALRGYGPDRKFDQQVIDAWKAKYNQ